MAQIISDKLQKIMLGIKGLGSFSLLLLVLMLFNAFTALPIFLSVGSTVFFIYVGFAIVRIAMHIILVSGNIYRSFKGKELKQESKLKIFLKHILHSLILPIISLFAAGIILFLIYNLFATHFSIVALTLLLMNSLSGIIGVALSGTALNIAAISLVLFSIALISYALKSLFTPVSNTSIPEVSWNVEIEGRNKTFAKEKLNPPSEKALLNVIFKKVTEIESLKREKGSLKRESAAISSREEQLSKQFNIVNQEFKNTNAALAVLEETYVEAKKINLNETQVLKNQLLDLKKQLKTENDSMKELKDANIGLTELLNAATNASRKEELRANKLEKRVKKLEEQLDMQLEYNYFSDENISNICPNTDKKDDVSSELDLTNYDPVVCKLQNQLSQLRNTLEQKEKKIVGLQATNTLYKDLIYKEIWTITNNAKIVQEKEYQKNEIVTQELELQIKNNNITDDKEIITNDVLLKKQVLKQKDKDIQILMEKNSNLTNMLIACANMAKNEEIQSNQKITELENKNKLLQKNSSYKKTLGNVTPLTEKTIFAQSYVKGKENNPQQDINNLNGKSDDISKRLQFGGDGLISLL